MSDELKLKLAAITMNHINKDSAVIILAEIIGELADEIQSLREHIEYLDKGDT